MSKERTFVGYAAKGANIFLSGMAGTGKSTLLREFIAGAGGKVDVTAPTGVAALNVGVNHRDSENTEVLKKKGLGLFLQQGHKASEGNNLLLLNEVIYFLKFNSYGIGVVATQ